MKIAAPLALLLSAGAWYFAALMAMNLLSGPFEERTCLTDCVQTYFYSALGLCVAGLVVGLVAVFSSKNRLIGASGLLVALPLGAIFLTVFVVGNFSSLIFP